jgi:ubiquinone/menaquinone biosynthesis C-methylase UbiE
MAKAIEAIWSACRRALRRRVLAGAQADGRHDRPTAEFFGSGSAKEFWNQKHAYDIENRSRKNPLADPIDYTQHFFLYRHSVSKPITGDDNRYWLDEIGERHLRPRAERMLALGCGAAVMEEQILERDFAGEIVAYEMSEVAVEGARRRLASTPWSSRIEIRCGSALAADLPDHSFDAVFVEAAIHHFVDIEPMFRLMHRVLRPGGLLLFDEYVGPDLHQYPPQLCDLLTRINACVPPELRRDYETGAVRERVDACPIELQLARDPTEGIHASEILPLTYRYFNVIDRRDYGGTIMRPFFNRILLNWDFEGNPKDRAIAELIILLEHELIRNGVIPTHNAVVVACPRVEPLPVFPPEVEQRMAYSDWKGLEQRHG